MSVKIKIFCWDNTPGQHDWHIGYAMTEHGEIVGNHCSSSHEWSKNDITVMHRPDYVAKFGEEGFEIIWLEDPKADAGWLAAAELNRKLGDAAALRRSAEKDRQISEAAAI